MESSHLTKKITLGPIDHVGLDLVLAARAWRRRLATAMAERGHAWLAEGRGALIEHIGRSGVGQLELTRRAGLTKQAVQQHLDELVADGVVERAPDPSDGRRNLVRFTAKGLAALAEANDVKRNIEQDYVRALGRRTFDELRAALRIVAELG
jgi:DNA-binding MarR family transcriptional regulator